MTEVPELAGQLRPDLILVNDDDLTYAKIRLDEHSLRTLIADIGGLDDQLAAALCWAAAWDMTRDGEMRARDFVALVLSGAPSIRHVAVLERVLPQATTAIRRYAHPSWRQDGVAQLEAALRGWLAAAQPGSDRQLVYARALAGIATSPESLELLAGLLDGSATIDGLAVDTELRWQLLHRLVSRGAAGPDKIEAELAARPHRCRRAARAELPGRDPDGGREGSSVGEDHRRQPAQRDVPRSTSRLQGRGS